MFAGPERDRLMIRELIDNYGDAVARRDAQAWGECWAEDAVWRFGGREVNGREAIVSTWHGAMAQYSALAFMAFPGSISIEGDRATVRTHTFEHLVPVDGPVRVQAGIYEDQLVQRDGRWLFAERRFNPREIRS
ncbi:nuclear transport factor 2 family protein [Sphingobium lactosutens]|uniref:nuclear transport factor 2 family protein n=1 Tax=Sphingobium lactosutens TaxID=522773 RepID=UPI0015BB49B4|nr:nuclear transport factor 2 family protein [Sphingobium lactosutens]NWK99138.1 nuclear transport factor 2 family protein [Sphingobium lactosutens]